MTIDEDAPLTVKEFIDLASSTKVKLIERLAGRMLSIGYQLSEAVFEFYRLDATDKGSPAWAEARAKRAKLDTQFDALKKAISSLQSTLKAERVGMLDLEDS